MGFPTSVTYSLTRGDLFVGQLTQLFRNRFNLGFLLVLSLVVGSLSLRDVPPADRSPAFLVSLLLVEVLFLLALGFAAMVLVLTALTLVRRHHGLLGVHTVELTTAGLVERTALNEGLHRWASIHRAYQTRRFLHIYVSEAMFHLIPVRGFASPAEAAAFLHEIRARAATAGGLPRPSLSA